MQDQLLQIGLLIAIALLLCGWLARLTESAKQRTQAVRDGTNLLNESFDYAERVLDDPATPEDIREILCVLVEVLPEREKSLYIIDEFVRLLEKKDRRSLKSSSFADALDKLHKHRPDLAHDARNALATGFLAMLLLHMNDVTLRTTTEAAMNPLSVSDAVSKFRDKIRQSNNDGPHGGIRHATA